jgi:hypothetical protein
LFVDSGAAGVPSALVQEMMIDENGSIVVTGLALRILVYEDNVNTVRVLGGLGLLTEYED